MKKTGGLYALVGSNPTPGELKDLDSFPYRFYKDKERRMKYEGFVRKRKESSINKGKI